MFRCDVTKIVDSNYFTYSNFVRSVNPMGDGTLKKNVERWNGQRVIITAGLVYQGSDTRHQGFSERFITLECMIMEFAWGSGE